MTSQSAAREFMELHERVVREREWDQWAWVADLRSRGVKAAHPDDGWVDRKKNRVVLCYPQFNLGLEVGDLIALGWPDKWRLVRVMGFDRNMLADDDQFYVRFMPLEG